MSEQELQIEHLSWPDVEAMMVEGVDTVVFACGAVEQHGPHLPMCVDAEHGTALAISIARRMGNTLVAPTVRIGVSEHHMAFPGTVSLQESTFRAVCTDYVTSMARHGFKRVCIVPTHGGNFRPLAAMSEHLDTSAGPDCRVLVYTDLIGMVNTWQQIVESECGLGERVGGHADIAETSLIEHLHPYLIRRERVAAGFQPTMEEDVITKIIADGFKTVTPNGILGDARGATARIGERCISEVALIVAKHFESP